MGAVDLYLPPSSRPLYHALISALVGQAADGAAADIVYLADYSPMPPQVLAQLRAAFPKIALSVRLDRAAAEDFATLPGWLPATLRRNWAPSPAHWFAGPAARPPDWLRPGYRNAYIYTTGHFLPKTLRQCAERIILREEGLGNYHSLPVSRAKAVLRMVWGRSPRHHFMGEENWVDAIEVASPDMLPGPIRHKASQLDIEAMADRLSPVMRRSLASALWGGAPLDGLTEARLGGADGQGAVLILTQPVDRLGICSVAEKQALYARMASVVMARGYRVVFKRHPQEGDGAPGGFAEIPAFFPVEAWPEISSTRFALAVSLCSAGTDRQARRFADDQLQLVHPEAFARKDLTGWEDRLVRWLDSPAAGGPLTADRL